MTDGVIEYLKQKYHPRALLVYGSFICGDNDEYSDFDCMLIVDEKKKKHDDTIINGIQIDCYIFTAEETEKEDAELFLTAYDAELVLDDGIGKKLKNKVRDYVRAHERIDDGEKELIVSWFRKTLERMQKDDDEGSYRAVTLLWESLADYFLLRNMFYFGSKKAILYLKDNDCKGYELFHSAVMQRTNETIAEWAAYVIEGLRGE